MQKLEEEKTRKIQERERKLEEQYKKKKERERMLEEQRQKERKLEEQRKENELERITEESLWQYKLEIVR